MGVWWQTTRALDIPAYPGYARLDGAVSLELSVTPAVVTPGDTTTLLVRLINHTNDATTSSVRMRLPVALDMQAAVLPAGITFNVQTREITWLPVLPGNEGVQEISLPLRVDTADLQHPEQVITAFLLPQQTLTTNAAAETAVSKLDLTMWVGIPPQITTVTNLVQVPLGQPVQLRADIAGSGPISQAWLLGDGRRVDVNDPVVIYPLAGVYQITLTAANPLKSVSRTQVITVVPHPSAHFTADDWNVGVGQMVTFQNQSGGQSPLTYAWDFGDGGFSDQVNPTHVYSTPGAYQVHLVIHNEFGQSEAFGLVTVGNAPITDLVIAASVPAGQAVTGQAYGDDTVSTYVWDMGDGRTYEGESVTHAYQKTGDFYVLLTAFNEFGSTQVGRWIHVDPGLLSTYLPLISQGGLGGQISSDGVLDGLDLEPIELDEVFVLPPVDLPANLTPAEQLYYYINVAREQFDLPPLNQVYELNIAAQQHTNDMSLFAYTAHIGADGSYPAERLLTSGYTRGYAGEATAWGFEHPYEAVEFWVNSPSHRRIILNQSATDVGVGYTVDFTAPNVWYWTAEFGNTFAASISPVVRLQEPDIAWEALVTTTIDYRWNWPLSLSDDQEFVLYFYQERQAIPMGSVTQPTLGSSYSLPLNAYEVLGVPGMYQWQVKLQQGKTIIAESEPRSINVLPDPNASLPTPVITVTLPIPTPTPTPTPTPGVVWPTPTPRPTLPPPPVFPTATPVP